MSYLNFAYTQSPLNNRQLSPVYAIATAPRYGLIGY